VTTSVRVASVVCFACLLVVARLHAHSGPPFPIVTTQTVGPYSVSVWTDPDSTDDGTAGGRFWVTVHAADGTSAVPPGTAVTLRVEPADRAGGQTTATVMAIDNDPTRRFVAVVMDHEGRYRVRVTIAGPLGTASVDSEVDATYDLRPPPAMLVVYTVPFVLVAFLWLRLLWKRRGHPTGTLNRDSHS
jgi:hypothetical protein